MTLKMKIYESDGSDGYSPRTWGWVIVCEEFGVMSHYFDGGWPSKDLAKKEGQKVQSRIKKDK